MLPGMVLGTNCPVLALNATGSATLRELPVGRVATVALGNLVFSRAER
jgi:hypothetical protein